MGLFKNYINQTRKPEGVLGKMMIMSMYSYSTLKKEEIASSKELKK